MTHFSLFLSLFLSVFLSIFLSVCVGVSPWILANRKQAKRALDALGDDGRDALQQLQLSSHGFQGISVK